jgi:hypothetical protein
VIVEDLIEFFTMPLRQRQDCRFPPGHQEGRPLCMAALDHMATFL